MPSNQRHKCAMVQLYCSEQIAIPETFPNILKTYAKAAIRTQPYDLLRWSAAYFRCLANNAPPPAKIRLERDSCQGSITKGYLKVLIAQVGKGFFISRCLLQERWKALCLAEDDLLKYLSLCRMLNWPQVHWLKVLAVMIGSLNESPNDTMVMLCELLTDDSDGGLARMPYWMFKICYTFVAKLDCSREQCFVNGQLVLPWGDLEDVTPMDGLPRVLSATLLKDTIITSCKAKFNNLHHREYPHPVENPPEPAKMDFIISSNLQNPKELFDKCEDFDTIMLLLQDAQEKPLTEDDFKGQHYISEKQLKDAQEREDKVNAQRQEQAEQISQNATEHLKQEALRLLHECGPPWTWLHQFTENNANTTSYNFIDEESIPSDAPIEDVAPADDIDVVDEKTKQTDDQSSSTSCKQSDQESDEQNSSWENFKTLVEDAQKDNKCDFQRISSVTSFLNSDEIDVIQLEGERFQTNLDIKEIINILDRAESKGVEFKDIEQMMEHVRTCLFGKPSDIPVPPIIKMAQEKLQPQINQVVDAPFAHNEEDSIPTPTEYPETIPNQVIIPPDMPTESEPKPIGEDLKTTPKDEITKVFENTVGIPSEQVAKMPKFCLQAHDEDELVLGLVPVAKPLENVENEDIGSELSYVSTDGVHLSGSEGYRQDDEDLLKDEPEQPPAKHVLPLDYFCCASAPTLESSAYEPPPQFHCSVKPMPGIGAAVSQKTIDDFLAFLRVRSRSQRGLINPRNFKEERCPYMVDTALHLPN